MIEEPDSASSLLGIVYPESAHRRSMMLWMEVLAT
jgi:hypothetical protein